MLQRIQSLFLLDAAICAALFIFLPFLNSSGSDHLALNELLLLIPAALIAVSQLGNIFLFNNRPLQIKIAWTGVLLNIVIVALVFILFMPETAYSFKIGAIFPLLSIVFCILSAQFIKKDENLVKSSERFR